VECLEGGPAREVQLRATRLSPDRAFAWQSSMPERAVLFVQRVRRRLVKLFGRVTSGVARRVRDAFNGGGSSGNRL